MSPGKTYQPRANSLAERVIGFLQQNPAECLSPADIAAKFDVAEPKNVHACLAAALQHGALARIHDADLGTVFMLPPSDAPPPARSGSGDRAHQPVQRIQPTKAAGFWRVQAVASQEAPGCRIAKGGPARALVHSHLVRSPDSDGASCVGGSVLGRVQRHERGRFLWIAHGACRADGQGRQPLWQAAGASIHHAQPG